MSFVPTDTQLREVAHSVIERKNAELGFEEAWGVVSDVFKEHPMTVQQLDYAAARVRWLVEQAEITLPAA